MWADTGGQPWPVTRITYQILKDFSSKPMAVDKLLVPPVGLEPTHLAVPDFESGASTNSTTGASAIKSGSDKGFFRWVQVQRLEKGQRILELAWP